MQKITPMLWFDNQAEQAKAQRAMQAMLGMKKIDLAALQRAFEGEPAASRNR